MTVEPAFIFFALAVLSLLLVVIVWNGIADSDVEAGQEVRR